MLAVSRKVMIAAALVAVVVLGSSRAEPTLVGGVERAAVSSIDGPDVERAMTTAVFEAAVVPGDDADGGALVASTVAEPDDAESGQLIPAIYARDPEVRFVYFRHRSGWM